VIIVDRALDERERAGNPIRVAMVGAGFMGHGIALQILKSTPGMQLVAIANRTIERARDAYAKAGAEDVIEIDDARGLERAIESAHPAVTGNIQAVAEAGQIDALIEVTGAVEHGAHALAAAIEHGKHVVLMNAELDGTVGPALKRRADSCTRSRTATSPA
jgi:predicted homoserine dehydrogenase-like protein